MPAARLLYTQIRTVVEETYLVPFPTEEITDVLNKEHTQQGLYPFSSAYLVKTYLEENGYILHRTITKAAK